MELFDLHCDTIVPLKTEREDFFSTKTQFNLLEKEKFNRICQTMAIFVPDDVRGEQAEDYFYTHYHYLKELVEKQSELVGLARNASDIRRITDAGQCAILLAIESGSALGGKLDNVAAFANCGVQMMTLTWNGENEIASGHNTDKGFTSFGRKVVREMEKENIIVDVSHLNDRGFDELCGFATKPFIATHSNLREICGHKRNLTDRQFGEIVTRKGLVGLNLYEQFLADDHKGTVEALFRHVYRMLELGGKDVIACGSDFDGADIDPTLDSAYKFASTCEFFAKQGLSDDLIGKIFFDNALAFFSNAR